MRKSMKEKIINYIEEQFVEESKHLYYTESPVDIGEQYSGCKYFLCHHKTNEIECGFKTQKELEKYIDTVKEESKVDAVE